MASEVKRKEGKKEERYKGQLECQYGRGDEKMKRTVSLVRLKSQLLERLETLSLQSLDLGSEDS